MIIIGGYGRHALSACDIYDAANRKWICTVSLNHPRITPAAAVLDDDSVVVLGGFAEASTLSSVDIFDSSSQT